MTNLFGFSNGMHKTNEGLHFFVLKLEPTSKEIMLAGYDKPLSNEYLPNEWINEELRFLIFKYRTYY